MLHGKGTLYSYSDYGQVRMIRKKMREMEGTWKQGGDGTKHDSSVLEAAFVVCSEMQQNQVIESIFVFYCFGRWSGSVNGQVGVLWYSEAIAFREGNSPGTPPWRSKTQNFTSGTSTPQHLMELFPLIRVLSVMVMMHLVVTVSRYDAG